jgi:hypothetical protein
MRHLKFCTILGLLLAMTAPAAAVSLPPGAFVLKTTTWDSGTDYSGLGTGLFQPPPNPPTPGVNPGPGAFPGEDTWGVLRVETIHVGNISTIDPFTITAGTQTWVHGDEGKELVGIFWGESDIKVTNFADPGGSGALIQLIEGTGLNFMIWEQDVGHFQDPTTYSRGSADRGVNPWDYVGVGDDASSVVWASGESEPGFVGTLLATEFKSIFSTDASATIPGGASAYFSMWTNDPLDHPAPFPWMVGLQNAIANSDYFTNGALGPADIFLNMATDLNNPANTPGGFDWTVTDNDDIIGYAIPEPLTMLGVFLGVSGLGGYVRKRLA